MSIRVLVVDDHALVRSGFAMVLSVTDDLEVVGQATDGRAALDLLATTPVDVVLMDVQMPVLDGIAATREIVTRQQAKVVILTTFDREDYLFDALEAGASGFLLKNTDPDDLVAAVRAVHAGNALLAPEMTLSVIDRLTGGATPHSTGGAAEPEAAGPPVLDAQQHLALHSLTPREREILVLLAQGLANAEIAEQLFLGAATVKTHVSNVLAKTGSRDRVQAVVFAYRTGLAPLA